MSQQISTQKSNFFSLRTRKNVYIYSFNFSRELFTSRNTVFSKTLLRRSIKTITCKFIKEEKFSSEDIDELKQLLDDKAESNHRKDR